MEILKDPIIESENQVTNQKNGEGSNLIIENSDIHGEDEASRLRALATDVRDQDDLERDIGRQVCQSFYTTLIELLTSFHSGGPVTCRAG